MTGKASVVAARSVSRLMVAFIAASQPAAHEVGHRRDEAGEVAAQAVKAGELLQRLLVHVERAVDFDLQAVAALGRAALAAHDLDPLVPLVDPHVVAELAQKPRDALSELAAAGRAVAVTEDEIGIDALALLAAGSVGRHRV